MKYYCPIRLQDGNILSCDMLRLTFFMDNNRLENFNKFINKICLEKEYYNYQHYTSRSLFNYRELVTFKHEVSGSSFTLGLGFNGPNKIQQGQCFIEFNPNKTLSNNYISPFLDYIKVHSDLSISRFDVAIDIPYSKEFCVLTKDIRSYSKLYRIENNNSNMKDCTEYLGKRNTNGFVKLYNKQIESKLKYQLTRLEITLDKIDYDNFIKHLPFVYFPKNISMYDLNSLNDTEKVLLILLSENSNCNQYLKMLGRVMQDKIKKILYHENSIVSVQEFEFYNLISSIRSIIN